MEQKLDRLHEVLKKQYDCIDNLLQLAVKETETLRKNELSRLSEICREIGSFSEKLAEMENQRIDVHKEIVSELNLNEDITLRELLHEIKGTEAAGYLAETANNISSAYTELKEQNELNQLLLKQSMSYLNKINEVLGINNRLTYGRAGMAEPNEKVSNSFVNKTV